MAPPAGHIIQSTARILFTILIGRAHLLNLLIASSDQDLNQRMFISPGALLKKMENTYILA